MNNEVDHLVNLCIIMGDYVGVINCAFNNISYNILRSIYILSLRLNKMPTLNIQIKIQIDRISCS